MINTGKPIKRDDISFRTELELKVIDLEMREHVTNIKLQRISGYLLVHKDGSNWKAVMNSIEELINE